MEQRLHILIERYHNDEQLSIDEIEFIIMFTDDINLQEELLNLLV